MPTAPDTKVTVGALAGAIVTVAVWGVDVATGVDVPGQVGAGLVTIVAFVLSYWVKDRRIADT